MTTDNPPGTLQQAFLDAYTALHGTHHLVKEAVAASHAANHSLRELADTIVTLEHALQTLKATSSQGTQEAPK